MTSSPLDFWMGAWRSGLAMADAGMKLGETVSASHAVIDSRVRSMADAARDPFNGNYAELGRMVPEKVEAFGKSAASGWNDMQAIQSDLFANGMEMMRIATTGRLPSAGEAMAMTSRSSRIVARAAASGGRALAPVHLAATGNARRLKAAR